MAAPKQFIANVKSVLSGDTLILTSPNNPTLERTFSLAYVDAPRLRKEGDEAFAFQSREHLRSLVLGKQIKCNVLYTIPQSGREYGTAQLQDGTELPIDAVKAGWLRVREDAGRKEEAEDLLAKIDELKTAESQAKSEEIGLHGKGGSIEVQNDLGTPDFFNQWKGKTVNAVIERVLSGDRVLARLFLSDKKHLQVMTLVAGIRTPATERTNTSTGATQAAEEFGNDARTYVENRILQRDVKIELVGVSPQGQLVGHILHPRGSIAEFLLADGLARCNDFHSTMLGEKMAPLRAAEKKAQVGKLRLHKNSNVKATDGTSSDMIVSKIHAADTIYVRNKAGEEKQVSLSSIRGPRAKEPSEAPFRDEAKEFLRKKLIGKHVKVKIDGTKPANEGFEARDVATISEKGKNINLQLVEEGWASVIRHRKDDTDRAENYDELLAAQEKAQADKKGMWSGKPSKAKIYHDASESVQKAKIQASALQRQKKIPGIVDFCKAGSRFTVLIPREGVKITLVLAGIRAPRAPRLPQEKGEPFGQEALDLANRRLAQRDVEIDVYDVDKVGGFIGDLHVNRESFGKLLVEEGLAEVHQYSAEKSGNAAELNAAQKQAKEGRKGKWHDWDPSQDVDEEEAAYDESTAGPEAQDKQTAQYKDVVVTNIDSNGKLKIQIIGSGTAALETLMNEFKKFHLDSKNNKALANPPKTGDVVAAKFSADNQWYRAKIRSNDRASKVAEVVYIDYGNSEKIPWSNLRALDQPQFTTQRLKPQAVDAVLSYVQLPTGDYFNDAIEFLAEATDGRKLVASVDFSDPKEALNYVTLFDASSGNSSFTDSLNREIVSAGLAMIPKKLKTWERGSQSTEVLKKLKEVESQAKSERAGMWEYGDITED